MLVFFRILCNVLTSGVRTTELQQLVINSPGGGASPAPGPASPALPGSTATTTVTTTATLVAGNGNNDDNKHERRPSWRLRMESSDKNRVRHATFQAYTHFNTIDIQGISTSFLLKIL